MSTSVELFADRARRDIRLVWSDEELKLLCTSETHCGVHCCMCVQIFTVSRRNVVSVWR